MRALPEIMRRRPKAQIVVIGNDGLSYGMAPPAGRSWKDVYFEEVRERIDTSRLHFLGHVPYSTFLEAIQISSAHIYFTYPFVLSWSALEAMSAGCVIIGSDTPPVREVIKSGETGLLVPFFDHEQLSERVVEVLQSPREFQPLRRAARRHIVENFDAKRICIPQLKEIVGSVTEKVVAEQNIASARSPPPRTRVAAAVKSRSAPRKKAT